MWREDIPSLSGFAGPDLVFRCSKPSSPPSPRYFCGHTCRDTHNVTQLGSEETFDVKQSPESCGCSWFVFRTSGVIGIDAQVCEEQGLATGLVAAALGLDRYENRVDVRQRLGIVESQYPALSRSTVFIENTEIEGLLPV